MIGRVAIIAACTLFAVAGSALRADACACVKAACSSIATADAVFEATVTSIELTAATIWPPGIASSPARRVALHDVRPLRGLTTDVVFTNGNDGSCGYDFQAGRRYLIVAHRLADGRLAVSTCGPTRPLSDASGFSSYLDNLQRSAPQTQVWGRVSIPRSWTDFVQDLDAISGSQITVNGPEKRSVTTGSDGRFSLSGLRPGTYTATANLPAALAGLAALDAQSFELSSGQPAACAEVNFVASIRSVIAGEVTDERGNPMGGVFVRLHLADQVNLSRGRAGAGTETDARGRYQFDDLPPGRYIISVNGDIGPTPGMPFAPVHARTLDGRPVALVELGGQVTMAPIAVTRLTPVMVSGVVRNRTGNPAAGAQIAATLLGDEGRTYRVFPVKSDANGRFQLRLWEGQRYRIDVGEGASPSAQLEIIASGAPLTLSIAR